MKFADSFTKSKDVRLILLPPASDCEAMVAALIASVVEELNGYSTPPTLHSHRNAQSS